MKEKIGSSKVQKGIAKDWFVLQRELPKGVYQLIAEYVGNSVYKPSYDVKKLIVGWYTEIRNLQEFYVVNMDNRCVTIEGDLVGTDDENDITYLTNRRIGFKIRAVPTTDMHPFEQMIDAVTIRSDTNETYAYTDAHGHFRFTLYFPNSLANWRYNLIITFGGDYDYVMCSEVRRVYLGQVPTKTILEVSPSAHIKSDGAAIFSARVYSYEALDKNYEVLDRTDTLKVGTISWYSSEDGKVYKRLTSRSESLARDGVVEHRMQFDYDLGESHNFYVKAVYSGHDTSPGYKSSESKPIHVTIDDLGDSANLIRMKLDGLDTEQKTVYYVAGEIGHKKLTLDYGTDNTPVPLGECVVTAKRS